MRGLNIDIPDAQYFSIDNMDELQKIVKEVESEPIVALDTETTGLKRTQDMPLFWSLSWGLPEKLNRIVMKADTMPLFADAFAKEDKVWVFANAKFDVHMLANAGMSIAGRLADVAVMHALLYEDMPHALKFMMSHIFDWKWSDFSHTFPRQKNESVADVLLRAWDTNPETLIEYAANDAYGTMALFWELEKQLEQAPSVRLLDSRGCDLLDIFWEIEVPYTKVLWKCERRGAKIDTEKLASLKSPIEKDLARLSKEIAKLTEGIVTKPGSNQQWIRYLFDHRGYPVRKKTKGGKSGVKRPCVDESVRTRLFEDTQDPALRAANEYSKLNKLYGTYIEGMEKRLTPKGYIHTSFNQDIARCLVEGTLILTNRGYIPVEEVAVGDLVLTHMGRPRRVTETSIHPPQPIYRVELANGLVLRTTGNHEYRTHPSGWTRADALKEGDVVTVHSPREEWRPIVGWEDFAVSSWGRVYNRKTGRFLPQRQKNRWGHMQIDLRRNGAQKRGKDRKTLYVHRLVLEAFGIYEPGREETRHLNGIAWDNTIRNLSCGSSSENTEDARGHGTLNGRPVLTKEQVDKIKQADRLGQPASSSSKLSFSNAEEIRRCFSDGETRNELADEWGVSYQAIDSIVKNRTWVRDKTGVSADTLAAQYGVSPAAIRDIWAGRRWDRDLNRKGQPQAIFSQANVVEITKDQPEVTYGLTVEEDHSHVTGGVVTHNTGRLSSSDPNLQNWPRRDEDNYKTRDMVVCEEGDEIVCLDYGQLEMRILADLAGEASMINMINEGRDIHMGNASIVFGIPYEDIVRAKKTRDEEWDTLPAEEAKYRHHCLFCRQAAKAIGFGLNYGMKENNLAARLGISKDEAKKKMEQYLNAYPAVRQFFDRSVDMTRDTGYAFTYLGRRRRLVDITSNSPMMRWSAERAASNVPIQGCLPARTRILTSEGMIPIGSVPPNGIVWTGTSWKQYDLLDRGSCELAEVELSNGQVLTCDTRHELLVLEDQKYQFKSWRDLREGDQVCISIATPLEFGDFMPDATDHFYWMGYALGNAWSSGGSSHKNALAVTFGDRKGRYTKESKAEEFARYVTEKLHTTHQKPEVHNAKITITVERSSVRSLWESMGYCWGKTAPHKSVPESVWSTTLRNRKAFLLGILDADGTVGVPRKNSPCIHLCQGEVLSQLQLVFRTVGVETINRALKDGSHRLDLNGAQAAKYLNYGRGKQAAKTPNMKADADATSAVLDVETTNPSHAAILNRVTRTRSISPYTARDIFEEAGASPPPIYATRSVVRTKALGVEEKTFTLSVQDPGHRFDSEGVISKNSAADIVKMAMILIDRAGLDDKYGYHMFHQVHDEVVGTCPKENTEQVIAELKAIMEDPLPKRLAVALPVDGGSGPSWGEAK